MSEGIKVKECKLSLFVMSYFIHMLLYIQYFSTICTYLLTIKLNKNYKIFNFKIQYIPQPCILFTFSLKACVFCVQLYMVPKQLVQKLMIAYKYDAGD